MLSGISMKEGSNYNSTDVYAEPATLSEYMPIPENNDQYPLEYIENYKVIKLKEENGNITIGICNEADSALLENLKIFHKKKVVFKRIENSELAGYLGKKLSLVDSGNGKKALPENERLLLDKLANDAPIINLVNSIMIEGIRKGVSDIHIESFSEKARVRYRLDGVLKTVLYIDRDKFPSVSSRIKIMANMNIMEKRLPQDGRVTVDLGPNTIDMRVSIIPIAAGESIVLRLFNKSGSLSTLEELGYYGENLKIMRKLFKIPHGLILITGPTGSGKTTTLNAILREIKSDTIKAITIEDPVEYTIEGIDQIQTNERIGLTFESLLRRVLRQDPDIIMVGEMRDSGTAEIAVRAALTGHLVFSTLHTNDAVSVINRLKNMGIETYLIAGVLRGAVAQRLVRKICPDCRETVKMNLSQRKIFEKNGFTADSIYEGKGCKLCNGTGYKGRIAVAELFCMDRKIEEMIINEETTDTILSYLDKKGMKTVLQSGLDLVVKGLTTIEEVERVVEL